MKQEFHILNLGAGVQSTTVYMMHKFDHAIFADTGDEPEGVYAHLRWLVSLKLSPIIVCKNGRLGDDLRRGMNSTGGRYVSIPSFTNEEEGTLATGMVRRQCTNEYKIQVIDRAIRRDVIGLAPRQRIPRNVHVVQYYGISLDEAGRASRIAKRTRKHKWLTVRFPLIEQSMTRTDCLNWLADKVPHQVPKSACVFCPYHSDAEWLRIKQNPADWKRAVEIDEALRTPGTVMRRKLNQKLYLHRSCLPLVQITFNPKPTQREFQTNLAFNQECLGGCGI